MYTQQSRPFDKSEVYNFRKTSDEYGELESFPNARNVCEKSLRENFVPPLRARQDNIKNFSHSSCNS